MPPTHVLGPPSHRIPSPQSCVSFVNSSPLHSSIPVLRTLLYLPQLYRRGYATMNAATLPTKEEDSASAAAKKYVKTNVIPSTHLMLFILETGFLFCVFLLRHSYFPRSGTCQCNVLFPQWHTRRKSFRRCLLRLPPPLFIIGPHDYSIRCPFPSEISVIPFKLPPYSNIRRRLLLVSSQ